MLNTMTSGIGCLNSANCGESIVENLATKLQIPLVEEENITGKRTTLEFQHTLKDELTPKLASNNIRGTKCLKVSPNIM